MKKINLLGYLSMALIFLFISCSDESSLIVNEKTSTYNNEDCGECEGQITSLDLEYLGNMVNATIEIYEGKIEPDKLFKTFYDVNTGDVLSFVGSKKNNKMGSKIFLTVNGNNPQEIHTSCSQDIYAGMTFGDYLIIAGTSHDGGPLCTTDVPGDGEDCGECEGQITSLDLEYLGNMVNATIEIYEGKIEPDKLFKTFYDVNTGDVLSFVGSKKNNKMGSKIFLTVNGNNPQEIHTSCSQDIYAGMTFGDYLIIAGTSHEGGNLPDANGNCSEEEEECEVAFGYKIDRPSQNYCFTVNSDSDSFLAWTTQFDLDYPQRGSWSYEYNIYGNANQCDLENSDSSIIVGSIIVRRTKDLKLTFQYKINENYKVCKINFYAGNEMQPINQDGSLNVPNSLFYMKSFETPVQMIEGDIITMEWPDKNLPIYIMPNLEFIDVD